MKRLLTHVSMATFAASALGAGKCYEYNEALVAEVKPADAAPASDGSDGAMEPFQAAVPCASPGEALFSIDNYAYNIVCGCAEAEGKTCTVPVGTKVKWRFADSEEHNITSIPNNFGMSGDTLSGTYEHVFVEPGEFGYGCTIHIADMSGYAVIVQ